jgi:hypothetical protein
VLLAAATFSLLLAFGVSSGTALAKRATSKRREHARVVAHMWVDDQSIRVDDVVSVDPRGSRVGRHAVVTLSFGDGTPTLTLRRLGIVSHRYPRPGHYRVVLSIRRGPSSSSVARVVRVRPRIVRVQFAQRTIVVPAAAVKSVHGSLRTEEVVVLRGATRRLVGRIISVVDSPQVPEGILGRVLSSQPVQGGGVKLAVLPADVSQAYRMVDVSTGGSLDSPGTLVENDAGDVIGDASDGSISHIGLHLGGTGVRCTGFDSAPPVDIDIDLSHLHWDLSFTYPSPSIHFLVTGSPTVTVKLGLNIATECHWTLPIHVVVPIPGTPLQVKISPVLQLSTTGSLGASFTWSPRLTYGFDEGNGISDEVHVFNAGTAQLGFGGTAQADVFFGPDAELSLGGRVGVSVEFGPDFEVSRSIATDGSCEDVDVGLLVQATAEADVFIAHWSFELFSGLVDKKPVFHSCTTPSAGGGQPPSTGTPGSGSSGSGPAGGGPSGGGGGGVPPTVPSGSYSETTGGVAHTWTNYTNAGGTEGPSIAANQTVGVACKVQGFQVADGNTWWYQIASPPWNNAYYVSADAFYNNGQTSGPLKGTPFADPNVPTCGGSPSPPPTWAETTGGVAHTWTNYTNAGGTQGPSIAANQTVQITCKLQGFRVADGNTWWYRIASSPWNNAFYVSADAFYNNGQTSGSLSGTPFVDPAVANC